MAKPSSQTLEERLLMNAVDTVAKNVEDYDPVVLIHLVSEVVKREDLQLGLYRVLANAFPADKLRALGIEPGRSGTGMAGTTDDVMNYLTLPQMHRVQLRGIQQLQEKLLPGGFLMVNKEVTHSDATRMLAQCTSQMEKVLRLTKAVKANAEVNRLKEAISAGLSAISEGMGPEQAAKVLDLMQGAMRKHLSSTKAKLDEIMEEAEQLGG